MSGLKDRVFAAADSALAELKSVKLHGSSEIVFVRRLRGGDEGAALTERMRMADDAAEAYDEEDLRDYVIVTCACEEDGSRLFTSEDAERVHELPLVWRMDLYLAALRHNGLTSRAVEDAEKNSEATRAGSSDSA